VDKHHLRRAILTAVKAVEPAAASITDIQTHPLIEMAAITIEQITAEMTGLLEREYLQNLRLGRAPLLRLTAKGRGQIEREEDLDEFIWGEFASKFAV